MFKPSKVDGINPNKRMFSVECSKHGRKTVRLVRRHPGKSVLPNKIRKKTGSRKMEDRRR